MQNPGRKILAICVTYFDGVGGRIMRYLPTKKKGVYKRDEG